jgi:ribulose bisphosphate carboxylase small subunit
MAKTMVQQFEENRRETAIFISALPTSKLAKNQIGDRIKALLVSAYATGFAHGSLDKEMTTEMWSLIVNETGNGTGNDFIREMINDIQFDFHALGGVK